MNTAIDNESNGLSLSTDTATATEVTSMQESVATAETSLSTDVINYVSEASADTGVKALLNDACDVALEACRDPLPASQTGLIDIDQRTADLAFVDTTGAPAESRVHAAIPDTPVQAADDAAKPEAAPRQARAPRKEQERRPVKKPLVPNVRKIRSPLGFNEDGADHLNIGSGAQATLSWRLSQNHAHMFVVGEDGPFMTVLGYWYWLLSEDQDNQFRDKRASDVRKLAEKKRLLVNISNFHQRVAKAYWAKITQVPGLKAELAKSELPFDAYYIFGERNDKVANSQVTIAEKSAKWLIPLFNEMREAAREDREPNFGVVNEQRNDRRGGDRRGNGNGNGNGGRGRQSPQSERQARDTWEAAGLGRARDALSGGRGQRQR